MASSAATPQPVSLGLFEKALIAFGGATSAAYAAEGLPDTFHGVAYALVLGLAGFFAVLGYKAIKGA